ncbi:ribonuclease HII [Thermococci archaeon]|nr:MAG: ribonuclease HII [Thermococci archaeon]
MKLGGIDEAGRGPVVGPLVIAAVVIDELKIGELEALGVKDSKKLSPKRREELFGKIIELVDDYFILELSPEDIDKREGTMNDFEVENFAKVLNSLKIKPDLLYIDAADVKEERFGSVVGRKLSFYPEIVAEHKADSKYIPVAAASILAKVTRDRAIERLKEIYGNIGSGYPSDPITRKFLEEYYKEHGSFPPVVRRSWKTLKKIEEKLQKGKNQSNLLNFLKKP